MTRVAGSVKQMAKSDASLSLDERLSRERKRRPSFLPSPRVSPGVQRGVEPVDEGAPGAECGELCLNLRPGTIAAVNPGLTPRAPEPGTDGTAALRAVAHGVGTARQGAQPPASPPAL